MTTSDSILAAAGGETAPGTMSEAATTDAMILAALDKLDPDDDSHWTTTGKPAMEAVNALLPAAITRARLDEVAPNFSRPEAPAGTTGDLGADPAGAGNEPQPVSQPFGGLGDHDDNGLTGGAHAPLDPAPSFILAPLKTEGGKLGTGDPNDPPEVSGLPAPGSLNEEGDPSVSVEYRLSSMEKLVWSMAKDLAFLRKQFGWPTKDD